MSKRAVEVFGSGSIGGLREISAASILLGHMQDGDWLGAAASLEGEQEALTTRQILERVSSNPTLARELILRLSTTLREVEDRVSTETLADADGGSLAETARSAPDEDVTRARRISILAGSEALRSLMGPAPIEDAQLPFLVGRVPADDEARPSRSPDLLIGDRVPFRLSRQHFMIARHDDRLLVSDLGSALGTIVNGEAIGHPFLKRAAVLREGENRILAGGRASPFEFVVLVS
ncbi:MAG TPA: FHA domain-containing protein [Stellaceae bacterium]|nr:FHA domain-containing protein [Stellaceae bacterium]